MVAGHWGKIPTPTPTPTPTLALTLTLTLATALPLPLTLALRVPQCRAFIWTPGLHGSFFGYAGAIMGGGGPPWSGFEFGLGFGFG